MTRLKSKLLISTVIVIIVIVGGVLSYSWVMAPPPVAPTSTPSMLTPEESLVPMPFHAYDRFPEPDSLDVPVTTTISITFSRPPQIVELKMQPEVEISHVDKERVGVASGKFTFHPAQPLQPETIYTVTIIYGQEEAPEGFRPTSTTSWKFTTGQGSPATLTIERDGFRYTMRVSSTALRLGEKLSVTIVRTNPTNESLTVFESGTWSTPWRLFSVYDKNETKVFSIYHWNYPIPGGTPRWWTVKPGETWEHTWVWDTGRNRTVGMKEKSQYPYPPIELGVYTLRNNKFSELAFEITITP